MEKEKEAEKQIFMNVVHPNGLVDTFYMSENKARKVYGDISIDESGYAIVEVTE